MGEFKARGGLLANLRSSLASAGADGACAAGVPSPVKARADFCAFNGLAALPVAFLAGALTTALAVGAASTLATGATTANLTLGAAGLAISLGAAAFITAFLAGAATFAFACFAFGHACASSQ